jgi:hypothetical protein
VRAERADEYETYYMEAGIQPLIDAALGVQALREDRGDEVEFVTISYWEDVAAMSRLPVTTRGGSTTSTATRSSSSSCPPVCRFWRSGRPTETLAADDE